MRVIDKRLADNDSYLFNHGKKHDPRYFAMLNNAVAITDTQYEGGQPAEALAYYDYLLHLDLPECPIKLSLPQDMTAAVQADISSMIDTNQSMKKLIDGGLASANLSNLIREIDHINEQYGKCYLASGWVSTQGGHLAVLKCRRLGDGQYAISIINHGGGMSRHRRLSDSGKKEKRSYQSDEYTIDLHSKNGQQFLRRIIELNDKSVILKDPDEKLKPYDADDLYGLLALYGSNPTSPEKIEEKNVTPQRSGTCTVTNVHAVARECLVERGADFNMRKRYHFVIKLRSLIDAFYQYRHGDIALDIMQWALREFSVRVNKHYQDILSEEELMYCGELHGDIAKQLAQDKKQTIRDKCIAASFPEANGVINNDIFIDKFKRSGTGAPESTSAQSPVAQLEERERSGRRETASFFERLSTDDIKPENLRNILEKLQSLKESEYFIDCAFKLFSLLPNCDGEDRSLWNKIWPGASEHIFFKLRDVCNELSIKRNKYIPDNKREKVYASIVKAYDIAAELAPKVAALKLGENFTTGMDDIYARKSRFRNPIVFYMIKQSIQNFNRRANKKKRVLTNDPNERNKSYDDSVTYVMRNVLDYKERSSIAKAKSREEGKSSTYYSDRELFDYLMVNSFLRDDNNNRIMPDELHSFLQISAIAHRSGLWHMSYEHEYNDNILYFDNKTHYLRELERCNKANASTDTSGTISIRTQLQALMHLPKVESSLQIVHQDYSENTIYHPRDSLAKFRNEHRKTNYKGDIEYSDQVSQQPYQHYPSGATDPDSTPWEADENQQQLFEEISEDLRRIDCSPHHQILRALAWAKNNTSHLQYAVVRKRIDEMVFEYGKLDEALAKQPETTINMMILFLQKIIRAYQNDEVDHTVFESASQLADDCRQHVEVAATLYHIPIERFQWPNAGAVLLDKIKSSTNTNTRSVLTNCFIREYQHGGPLRIEDCCHLLICRIIEKLGAHEKNSDSVWGSLSMELKQMFSDNANEALALLSTLIPEYVHMPFKPIKIENNNIVFENSEYFIDLNSGQLIQEGVEDIKDITELFFNQNSQKLSDLGLSKNNMTIHYSPSWKPNYRSSDGCWEFEQPLGSNDQTHEIGSILHMITINGIKHRFINTDVNNQNTIGVGNLLGNKYQHWSYDQGLTASWKQVNFTISDNTAFLYQDNSSLDENPIEIYERDDNQNWVATDKVILNLMNPKADIEKAWRDRLGLILGMHDLRTREERLQNKKAVKSVVACHVIATMNKEKQTFKIDTIQMLSLGLTFHVDDNNRLKSQDFPGFHLLENKSHPALSGFTHILQLENANSERKLIIPAFAFHQGLANNAFNHDNVLDTLSMCNSNQQYYTYTYGKHNELVAPSVEANLYLAMLYRSLGDFRRAMHYLHEAKNYKIINAESVNIIMQALKRKMQSPLAAAFDLKLNCFLSEHQQKWSKDREQIFNEVKIPKDWQKWCKKQLELYINSFSHYKIGISIFPVYCRLTENELLLHNISEATIDEQSISKPAGGILNNRIRFVSLRQNFLDKLREFKKSKPLSSKVETLPMQISQLPKEFRKLHHRDDFTTAFIFRNFIYLFNKAVSQTEYNNQQVRIVLFELLQNNAKIDGNSLFLISLLNFSLHHPEFFNKIAPVNISANVDKTISQIIDIFLERKQEINVNCPLVDDRCAEPMHRKEIPKPGDFTISDVTFAIDEIPHAENYQHPLKAIIETYFDTESQPLASGDFALSAAELTKDADYIEKAFFTRLMGGHEINKTKQKTVYSQKADTSLDSVRQALREQKQQDQTTLSALHAELLKLANKTPLDDVGPTVKDKVAAYNLLLARASEHRPIIKIDDLFQALLHQSPQILIERNPFLTQDNINQLFAQLCEYALCHSRVDQIDSALGMIKNTTSFNQLQPYELQEFAKHIGKKRRYDIHAFPEFLMYEYATKRLLRADQVDILKRLIQLIEADSVDSVEYHHGLLQFAAGGGKTSVLIPILAQRFARKGFLPVIFNTSDLYEIGLKEIPDNLRASFKQHVEVIERELDHVWTVDELNKLYKDLNQWRAEGKCLLLKPVTWHSINLAFKQSWNLGLNLQGSEFRDAVMRVLTFFKEHAVKLEDECHIISDALHKSIKTYGDQKSVPDDHLTLLTRFYDHLMNNDHNTDAVSREIAELAGIVTHRKRSIHIDELSKLKELLTDKILADPMFADIINKDALKTYWLNPNKQRPDWLKALYHKDETKPVARLVVLARAFLQTHLSFVLSRQFGVNFGYSMHAGDLTAAPKREGKDVPSHFADHTLVAALTMQLYHLRGLKPEHGQQLLTYYQVLHDQQRQQNPTLEGPTNAEIFLLQHIPNYPDMPFTCCYDLTPALMSRLAADPQFVKNPHVIKMFLNIFALPQIKIPPIRLSSSAAELQAGFKRSILFSATPGLREQYPAFLEENNCLFDAAFEAEVIDTLLQKQNVGVCQLQNSQTPAEFFEQIPTELLTKMTTLIDRGALLTDFDIEQTISDYLGLAQTGKPTYQTSAYFKASKLHVKSRQPSPVDNAAQRQHIKDMAIDGAGLAKALTSQGINPEQFLLFLFLDLSKTTGTDIKRPYRDHAGLTIGKKQTITETIQAAMRERQLLEKDAQSITWLMFESLYHEIYQDVADDSFDPKHAFYWMIHNEAQDIKEKLINRAYQGIEQVIAEFVIDRDLSDYTTAESIDLFRQYYEEKQDIDPWHIYELESTLDDAETVLKDYLNDRLHNETLQHWRFRDFSSSKLITLPAHLQKRVDTIISQTAALIDELSSPQKTQLGNEVQQEHTTQLSQAQETQQRQKMKNKIDSAETFMYNMETYKSDVDTLTNIFSPSRHAKYTHLRLVGVDADIKSPELLLEHSYFRPLQPGTRNIIGAEYITYSQRKPIDILLVEIKPGANPANQLMRFCACTSAGCEYYSTLIDDHHLQPGEPAYMLINVHGDILHHSKNIAYDNCRKLVKQPDSLRMLTYTQMLNGQVNNIAQLADLIKFQQWSEEDFHKIINDIKENHVSQHPVNLEDALDTLKQLDVWAGAEAKNQDPHVIDEVQAMIQKRYQPRKREQSKLTTRQLTPATESALAMIAPPEISETTLETALEGYLFERPPVPVNLDPEGQPLRDAVTAILVLPQETDPMRRGRKNAILHTQQLARDIMKSPCPREEKMTFVTDLQKTFVRLDSLLGQLHDNINRYNPKNTKYISAKHDISLAIDIAYSQYAAGEELEQCIDSLRRQLELIALHKSPTGVFANIRLFQAESTPGYIIKDILQMLNKEGFPRQTPPPNATAKH